MEVRWTIFDKIIAALRYSKVKRHINKDCILCDIGCGFNGAFLLLLSNKISRGIGFDRKVSENKWDNICLYTIENLEHGIPLNDQSVDCVTMIALLEHLNNPSAVLSEVYRILKPNGKLILTTPTPLAKPVLEFLAFKLNVISREEIEDHKCYYNKKMIRELFNRTGFKESNVELFQFGFNSLAVGYK